MLELFFLLLPIAAFSGWYIGRKNSRSSSKSMAILHKNYFVGLNYLINEQPDKAVDVFIKMLEVDSDTVETHLALGNLFRRRGEVDRAIRIHQNLIARPQLDKHLRIQALSELGQDYMSAGVFDRAEGVFLELVESDEESISSLHYLSNIYQQQKDWEQAIVVARKLESASGESMHKVIAHYYCELAERKCNEENFDKALRYLRSALSIDKNCVRACLIQADIEVKLGNLKSAIRCYKRVKQQDPDFISEVVEALSTCYKQLNNEAELVGFLQDCLKEYPRVPVMLALSEHLRKWQGDKIAIEFIAEQIRKHASMRALNHLIELYLSNSEGDAKDKLFILRTLVNKLLADKPVYRCHQCGFSSKTLYWQCPSCKDWSTVKPIHGLEGD